MKVFSRNKKNFTNSCIELKKDVVELIYKTDENNKKIEITRWLGRFLTHNFISIYSMDEVEDYLSNIILNNNKGTLIKQKSPIYEFTIMATTLYKHGGHTRMIEATISCLGQITKMILSQTKNSDKKIVEMISQKVEIFSPNEEKKGPEEKILWLYEKLQSYKKVILYINPDDIESTLAIRIDRTLNPNARKYYFVNHSDHTFSFGRSETDEVLEVSSYGWKLGGRLGLASKQNFLGIPLHTTVINESKKNLSMKKIVISGGAAFKFKKAMGFTLSPYLENLLKSNKNIIVYLIGPSYTDSIWLIALKMIYPIRFNCIKRLDYLNYKKLLRKADVYVDSYPITGGTAFTEALINGLKVIGITGFPSGYGYADNLRVRTINDFTHGIQDLIDNDQKAQIKQNVIRANAVNYHCYDAFGKRLEKILINSDKIKLEIYSKKIIPEYDYSDIYKEKGSAYCPEVAGISLSILLKLIYLGAKNKVGVIFIAKLIARWIFSFFSFKVVGVK